MLPSFDGKISYSINEHIKWRMLKCHVCLLGVCQLLLISSVEMSDGLSLRHFLYMSLSENRVTRYIPQNHKYAIRDNGLSK